MPQSELVKEVISVLKGLRNGIYYGGKVRLVHSLVMMLLFKSVSKAEIKNIARLGFEHAKNLGLFVFSYKSACYLLEKLWGAKSINNFIAGFVFGGLVFGRKTPVKNDLFRSMCKSCSIFSAEFSWHWQLLLIKNSTQRGGRPQRNLWRESTDTFYSRHSAGASSCGYSRLTRAPYNQVSPAPCSSFMWRATKHWGTGGN